MSKSVSVKDLRVKAITYHSVQFDELVLHHDCVNLAIEDKEILSKCYEASKSMGFKKAKKLIQGYLHQKSSPYLWNLYAKIHVKRRRFKEAHVIMHEALSLYPYSMSVRINLANMLLHFKEYLKIDALFGYKTDLGAESISGHITVDDYIQYLVIMGEKWLGQVAIKRHRKAEFIEKAKAYYTRAVSICPKHPSISYLEKKLFAPSSQVVEKFNISLHRIIKSIKRVFSLD